MKHDEPVPDVHFPARPKQIATLLELTKESILAELSAAEADHLITFIRARSANDYRKCWVALHILLLQIHPREANALCEILSDRKSRSKGRPGAIKGALR